MKGTQLSIVPFKAVGERTILPDPGREAEAFARIGYRLEEAVADVIDNSIDANATQVLIRFVLANSSIQRIVILDNGRGLTDNEIDSAMQFGGPSNKTDKALGKYGIGLKTSSFSQCKSISMLSRHGKESTGRRWTVKSIGKGWICEDLSCQEVGAFLDQNWGIDELELSGRGTAVVWDDLDSWRLNRGHINFITSKYFPVLQQHLGLIYHRFLSTGQLRIRVDSFDADTGFAGFPNSISPMDPFSYPRSGAKEYPMLFEVAMKGSPKLELEAHIWPPNSKDPGYKLGGGKIAARQGFYFYRNDRLIQAGGWNEWRLSDAEPHTSLARVKINLPSDFDGVFRLNVQKSKLDAPDDFIEALNLIESNGKTFQRYVQDANDIYRKAKSQKTAQAQVAFGSGVPACVRNTEERFGGPMQEEALKINITWKKLQDERLFDIDYDTSTIWVNSTYRESIEQGGRNLDLFKTMLGLLLRDKVKRERLSKEHKDTLELINRDLLAVIG